jgi:hypothetical protein
MSAPPRPRRTPCVERLHRICAELGYVTGQGVLIERLARDIGRRARGSIAEARLRALFHRGRELDCADLVVICDGLDLRPEEVLYDCDGDGPPPPRRRPADVRLMDVIPRPL